MSKPKVTEKVKEEARSLKSEMARQMLTLSTSGFGLVAALAWNELIKELVGQYIKPLVGGSSGIISLAIYAVLVTVLAVIITYNLTKLTKKN